MLNREALKEFYLLNVLTYNLEGPDTKEFTGINFVLRSLQETDTCKWETITVQNDQLYDVSRYEVDAVGLW